jgi:Flp pilus assembly protein TadG
MLAPALPRHARRSGKILILFVFVMTALFGMLGLIFDGGLAQASHRRTQNVADAAALGAAMELMRGAGVTQAKASAEAFVSTFNRLSNASLTVNIPPASGPYAGNANYAEAIITRQYNTMFIKFVGGASSRRSLPGPWLGSRPSPPARGRSSLTPTPPRGLTSTAPIPACW